MVERQHLGAHPPRRSSCCPTCARRRAGTHRQHLVARRPHRPAVLRHLLRQQVRDARLQRVAPARGAAGRHPRHGGVSGRHGDGHDRERRIRPPRHADRDGATGRSGHRPRRPQRVSRRSSSASARTSCHAGTMSSPGPRTTASRCSATGYARPCKTSARPDEPCLRHGVVRATASRPARFDADARR